MLKRAISLVWGNNNFLSMFGNVVFAGIAFVSFAILARSYPTQDFGQYMIFVSGGALLEMIRFGLTRTSIVKYLAGCNEKVYEAFVGSNYAIGLAATLAINVILWVAYAVFYRQIEASGFHLLFKWYPWMALANIPMNNAISLLQAKARFARILYVRTIATLSFFLYVVLNFFVLKAPIQVTIVAQIGTQLLTSMACAVLGWDGIRHIFKANRYTALRLFHFGKYSMGTLLSTSLLKSADTFILGLMPTMGVHAVAIYSIPLKLTELFEIPLRSFVATVFPRMSNAAAKKRADVIEGLFHDYTGMLFFLFIPLLIVCEVLAPYFVLIFGGQQYAEAIPVFCVYILYGIFLPLDRMTGITLDSLGMPKFNLYKVIVMAAVNIIGDILAIMLFKSLVAVALVTVLNTFIGSVVGYRILQRHLQLSISLSFARGWVFIRDKYISSYERISR